MKKFYVMGDKMCGICGIIGKEDKNLIEKMCDVMRHRGPDSNGVFSDTDISLGHNRLSIIDLKKGNQPIHNENDTIWVVFNGEIYNFKELKKELKEHDFYTQTDTEVLVHLYEEYGEEFVKKLRGMFAFGIWDSNKKKLILARDHMGKKPLYYYLDQDQLIFASEIKSILETGVKKEINLRSVCSYLAYLYVLGNNTLFKGIKKLMAGHMAIYTNNNLKIKKYWDISENINNDSELANIKKLRSILEESVEYRMVSDVPIGAFLSGGIDSSAIVSLAKKHVDYDFHTFSLGFETFSELEYAREFSEYLDTEHHEIVLKPENYIDKLHEITWHHDEPLGDAAAINFFFLSNLAHKYVKVVIAGEGGDELLGGYPNYKRNLKILNLLKLPYLGNLSKKLIQLYPKSGDIYQNRIKWILSNYLPQFTDSFNLGHLNSTRSIRDMEMKWLTNFEYGCLEKEAVKTNGITDYLNKMLFLDCKYLLPERYLMKSDKTTMANSIEERLPLIDKHLIEFAFSVPPHLKLKNGTSKYMLKMAVKDYLPREIIKRPKMGFGTPVNHWIRDENLKEMIITQFDESSLIRKYFKEDKLDNMLKRINRENSRDYVIWTIFALGIWYDTYFN